MTTSQVRFLKQYLALLEITKSSFNQFVEITSSLMNDLISKTKQQVEQVIQNHLRSNIIYPSCVFMDDDAIYYASLSPYTSETLPSEPIASERQKRQHYDPELTDYASCESDCDTSREYLVEGRDYTVIRL